MDKITFKNEIGKMLDADAHYTNGTPNRTITQTEMNAFLDHLYGYVENMGTIVDTTKLAFALIKTKGKYDSCQQQAVVIANLL